MPNIREHGLNISLNTVATLVPVLAVVWFLLKPAMIEAIADDLDEQIDKQSEPLQNAFKVILKVDINELKKSIALLEFREEHDPDSWTSDHANILASRKIELEALEEAYAEL
jgi:hypothetical protein